MKRQYLVMAMAALAGGGLLSWWLVRGLPVERIPEASPAGSTATALDEKTLIAREVLKPMSQYGAAGGVALGDIQILNGTIRRWRGGNGELPPGVNSLLTEALCSGGKSFPLLARDHSCIGSDGRLNDRWGSPVWFHESGRNRIDIGFAGPDRTWGTNDDLMLVQGRVLSGEELKGYRADASEIARH